MSEEPILELERLLEKTRRELDGVNLEVAALEDGRPRAPALGAWAERTLGIASEPAANPVRPAPAPSAELPSPPQSPPESALAKPPIQPEAAEPPTESYREEKPPPRTVSERPTKPALGLPPRPPAAAAAPGRRRASLAIVLGTISAATLAGLALRLTRTDLLVSAPDLEAFAGADDGLLLLSRAKGLERVGKDGASRDVAGMPACTGLAWSEGALYGVDGRSRSLKRWTALDSPPQSFPLDHAPSGVFARGSQLWTLDAEGRVLRQHLLNRSILGLFLQQIDSRSLKDLRVESVFVSESGRMLALEKGGGRLALLSASGSELAPDSFDEPTPGARLRLGARGGQPWLAVIEADGARLRPYRGPLARRLD